MYTRLDHYIGKHIVFASLLILFLLIALRAIFALLEESNSIGKGDYQLADAILYVGLMLPLKILEIFPMGVLIGTLFGFGLLASNNELTIMRASGMTTWRIAGAGFKASILLIICVLFLSEVLSPFATQSAKQLKMVALSSGKVTHSSSGLWAKNNQQMIQIANVLNPSEWYEISIYNIDKNYHLSEFIYAKKAKKIKGQWFLLDIQHNRFLGERIEKTTRIRERWDNPLDENNIEAFTLKPETLNLLNLIQYKNYLNKNQLDSEGVSLILWQKMMMPLSIAVMILLGLSFVLGPMRDVSMGARIVAGVFLGFGFHLVKQSFGPISLLYHLPPFLGAIFPIFIFSGIAFYLMKKLS
jgi:lipopolysaccharide export system permease protein